MQAGPEACGVPRPTWAAPLLAKCLKARAGVEVGERSGRRGLESLGYVLRRPVRRADAAALPSRGELQEVVRGPVSSSGHGIASRAVHRNRIGRAEGAPDRATF